MPHYASPYKFQDNATAGCYDMLELSRVENYISCTGECPASQSHRSLSTPDNHVAGVDGRCPRPRRELYPFSLDRLEHLGAATSYKFQLPPREPINKLYTLLHLYSCFTLLPWRLWLLYLTMHVSLLHSAR